MNPELQAIVDFVNSVTTAGAAGIFAGASVLFYGIVKVYRLNSVQALVTRIPIVGRKLCWDSWPKPVTVAVVLGLPVLGAVCAAIASGAAPIAVVSAGVAALIAALTAGGVDGAVSAVRPTPPAKLEEARRLSDALHAAGVKRDPLEG